MLFQAFCIIAGVFTLNMRLSPLNLWLLANYIYKLGQRYTKSSDQDAGYRDTLVRATICGGGGDTTSTCLCCSRLGKQEKLQYGGVNELFMKSWNIFHRKQQVNNY